MIGAILTFAAAVTVIVAMLAALFAPLALMLWLVDRVARARGLSGAHPLSPAVACALLVWAVLGCAGMVAATHAMNQSATLTPKHEEGRK